MCGYPDASNTGVSRGVALRTINGNVTLSQDGAVLENAVISEQHQHRGRQRDGP